MRLSSKQIVKSHPLLVGIDTADHHPQGEAFTVIVNSQSIASHTAYELRTALSSASHKVMRGFLRGPQQVSSQGYIGAFFMASDVADESVCIFNAYSSYIYMGGFSRLHGDSYLTPTIFGTGIRLRDAWIDGSEGVLEFYNTSGISRNLPVYGTVVVK